MTRARSGDLGRRVAERRREVGLTREDVAVRAGMSSGYLEYLEHSLQAALTAGTLLRLPIHPLMGDEDVSRVVEAVCDSLG